MEITPQTFASLAGLGADPKPNSISPFFPQHLLLPAETHLIQWSPVNEVHLISPKRSQPHRKAHEKGEVGGREGNGASPGTAAILSLLLTEASTGTEKDLRLKHEFTQQGSDPAGLLDPVPELLESENVQPLSLTQKALNPPVLSD